jgi:hypothetical protein
MRYLRPKAPPAPAKASRVPSPVELVKAVFTRHLRVKRSERGLEVVLEDQSAEPAAPRIAPQVSMQAELRGLLDAQAGSRKVFRALAVIEYQLRKRDALFIHDLKLPALRETLRQLDGLVQRPGAGLTALRTQLLDAIALRERLEKEDEERRPPSTFIGESKLQVGEGSLSDFDRALGGT